MPDSLINTATKAQVYLERLKAGFVRDWSSVHADLRASVRAVLTALEVENLRELNRRELNRLLVEIQEAHLRVSAVGMARFSDELAPLAEFAALLELKNLNALGGAKFRAPTAELAYAAAKRDPIQATGQLLDAFIRDWADGDAARVANYVRTGWAQGQTLQQMIANVAGTARKKFADGTLDISRRHAGTVIQTATQHVANSARMATWERNGDLVIGYHWVATLDRRTTQQCRSLDTSHGVGAAYFLPGQGPMPPIHPNCRSTTAPKLSEEFDFLDEGATRASAGKDGGKQVPVEGYYDWLKKQPADFQDFAIGPTRGKLLRDGGLSATKFADLELDTSFQPLTLAEMRAIEPEAFARAGL